MLGSRYSGEIKKNVKIAIKMINFDKFHKISDHQDPHIVPKNPSRCKYTLARSTQCHWF